MKDRELYVGKESQIWPAPGERDVRLQQQPNLLEAMQRQMVESETTALQNRGSPRPHLADQISSPSSLMANTEIPGHAPTQHQQQLAGVQSREPVGESDWRASPSDTQHRDTRRPRVCPGDGSCAGRAGCLPLHHFSTLNRLLPHFTSGSLSDFNLVSLYSAYDVIKKCQ